MTHCKTCTCQPQGGPYTSHGHSIEGVTVHSKDRPSVARCGGPGRCSTCSRESAVLRAEKGLT